MGKIVNHPDDRNAKRRAAVCKAFNEGKSAGEIAKAMGMTRETAAGIIARSGLSRGEKPAPPRRFSWEDAEPLRFLPPGL